MSLTDVQSLTGIAGTTIGILGGLFGLYKYLSDKRETELREWQKVIIYTIFRQSQHDQLYSLSFSTIREKYLREAQAVIDINLTKKEISENALRRVLLELTSSNILSMGPSDSFRLNARPDPDIIDRINHELVAMLGSNPFVYTVDEVTKQIAPTVGIEIPLLRSNITLSIAAGVFVLDDLGRMAFKR